MDPADIGAAFAAEGLTPSTWDEEADHFFASHRHDADKVLYCLEGSITFHVATGDVELGAGSRLDLPAGTEHAATVGPHGVVYMEAFTRSG